MEGLINLPGKKKFKYRVVFVFRNFHSIIRESSYTCNA